MSEERIFEWVDEESKGFIGVRGVNIVSTLLQEPYGQEDDLQVNCEVVLFHYDDSKALFAMRWSLAGACVDLLTEDLEKAKGSIQTMMIMEAANA